MKKIFLILILIITTLFVNAQSPCQADFSHITNGPGTIVFSDLSTINPTWSTNYSVTWDWDLGDGNYSTQQNPTHTYASPGPNNGWYWACLTVTYFDSTTINTCTSFYCDSIFVGNSIPYSWDCDLVTGCYDPGTGLGQYTSLASCQSACSGPIASWDCDATTAIGCYDPGTGLGQYTSLVACQSVCAIVTSSWNCIAGACIDPGTGLGSFTDSLLCVSSCVTTTLNYCDSMIVNGSQNQPIFEIAGVNIFIDHWVTTANDGTVLGEDSMSILHNVYNYPAPSSLPYDTINVCITYSDAGGYYTCCVMWIWNPTLGVWAKMGSLTSIEEIDTSDKKLIKVVDILGRETSINSNQTLFFIYEDGMIEKRYIVNRK